MGSRIRVALGRAKYAAVGAAIGAGIGGLASRNAASSGGGLGALVGAALWETRISAGSRVDDLKSTVETHSGRE